MASPAMTKGTLGNVANGTNIPGNSSVTFTIYPNASATLNLGTDTVFETQVEVKVQAGATVSASNGVTVSCYAGSGSGNPPDWETVPSASYQSPTIAASGTTARKVYLPTAPGWQVTVANNDTTNAVTVYVTADTVSSIA